MPIQRRGLTRRRAATSPPPPDTTILYWWLTPSSRADSGIDVKYLVKLHQDRNLSCDCPGWQYSKTEPKACRHTAGAERPRANVLDLMLRREALPVLRNRFGLLIAAPGNYVDESEEIIEAAVALAAATAPPPKKKRRVVTPSGSVLVEDNADEVKPTYDRKIEL